MCILPSQYSVMPPPNLKVAPRSLAIRAWMRKNKFMLNDAKTDKWHIKAVVESVHQSYQGRRNRRRSSNNIQKLRSLVRLANAHVILYYQHLRQCLLLPIYNIRHTKKDLSRECTEKLEHAFTTSTLDYCIK